MSRTAQRLGATAEEGAALARGQYAETYPLLPDGYRSAECNDGRALDPRLDDPRFPS